MVVHQMVHIFNFNMSIENNSITYCEGRILLFLIVWLEFYGSIYILCVHFNSSGIFFIFRILFSSRTYVYLSFSAYFDNLREPAPP